MNLPRRPFNAHTRAIPPLTADALHAIHCANRIRQARTLEEIDRRRRRRELELDVRPRRHGLLFTLTRLFIFWR